MKKTLSLGALVVLAAMTTACSFKIFEDVGTDPHPPTIELIGVRVYVAPVETTTTTTDRNTAAPHGRSIAWDTGITMASGELFQIAVAYTDAGADITAISLRDRDGSLIMNCVEDTADQSYFEGTSGAAICVEDGYELAGVSGPHRLELWAEDSHESRSEKVEFVITISPR